MNTFYLNNQKTTTMRKKMTDDITSYGDVYLEELSKNVEEGKEILNNSGIDIVSATDLDDAAKKNYFRVSCVMYKYTLERIRVVY